MKRPIQFRRHAGHPGRVRRFVTVASGLAIGLTYCRAAKLDEERGFPLTAAFEWRKAAELLRPFAPLAGRCWQEWERLMGLPRWLAAPVGDMSLAPVLLALDKELDPAVSSDRTHLPVAA